MHLPYDRWYGVIPIVFGIYMLLVAYRIYPGVPKLSEEWHKKNDAVWKIIWPVPILCGIIALVIGNLR
jgi:hypothetical protein